MKRRNEEITFKDILGIFIPKIWIIIAVSALLAIAFGVRANYTVQDTYTAQTVFRVKSTSSAALSEQGFAAIDKVLANFEYKMRGDDFFVPVVSDINEYHPDKYTWVTSSYISSVVRYSPIGDGILVISVTTPDSRLSYAISSSLLNFIPKNLADENPGLFDIAVYDPPNEKLSVNPKPVTKNAVIGFVIGAVVSAAAVWIYSALDVVVRNKKKIEDYFEIPVIAVIPVKKSEKAGESQNV